MPVVGVVLVAGGQPRLPVLDQVGQHVDDARARETGQRDRRAPALQVFAGLRVERVQEECGRGVEDDLASVHLGERDTLAVVVPHAAGEPGRVRLAVGPDGLAGTGIDGGDGAPLAGDGVEQAVDIERRGAEEGIDAGPEVVAPPRPRHRELFEVRARQSGRAASSGCGRRRRRCSATRPAVCRSAVRPSRGRPATTSAYSTSSASPTRRERRPRTPTSPMSGSWWCEPDATVAHHSSSKFKVQSSKRCLAPLLHRHPPRLSVSVLDVSSSAMRSALLALSARRGGLRASGPSAARAGPDPARRGHPYHGRPAKPGRGHRRPRRPHCRHRRQRQSRAPRGRRHAARRAWRALRHARLPRLARASRQRRRRAGTVQPERSRHSRGDARGDSRLCRRARVAGLAGRGRLGAARRFHPVGRARRISMPSPATGRRH